MDGICGLRRRKLREIRKSDVAGGLVAVGLLMVLGSLGFVVFKYLPMPLLVLVVGLALVCIGMQFLD